MTTQIPQPEAVAPAQSEVEDGRPETAVATLTLHKSGQPHTVKIESDAFLVGRNPRADLPLPDLAFVSGQHLVLRRTPQGYTIEDLNSTNGTRLNNRQLVAGTPVPIHEGDIIRIGEERFGVSVGLTFHNPAEQRAPVDGYGAGVSRTQLLQIERLTIGRDPQCDIVLDSPTVARVHAIIEQLGDEYHTIRTQDDEVVTIWVNDRPTRQARLQPGDNVQIGPHLLTYDGKTLTQFDSQGFRLDVIDVHKDVKTKNGPLRILDDISLTVKPREFVALVGGSGAGKSTLLDALNGFRPAQGQVLVNGRDLYRHYDSFRTQLGYVPQYDILPTKLKVEDALRYTARLRLPNDVSAAERERRISQVLETVEMNSERLRQTRIDQLSGGQRKRVSIAAELIADPKLLFLDEPSSGLDPGLEKKLMYTLRKMADEGRTIIIITHATANIVQVDYVGFLSQGYLTYFGPPQKASDFFQVGDFADIYEKIEGSGKEWRRIFTGDRPDAYRQYVLARQKTLPAARDAGSLSKPGFSLRESASQFWTLSQRIIRLTVGDRVALFLALIIMPLVALLQAGATGSDALVGDPAIVKDAAAAAASLTEGYRPASDAHVMLSTMAVLAFLAGAFSSSQELLKERSIYLRERMINLQLLPYLGSKFFVFGVFAIIQALLYLLIVSLKVELPSDGQLFIGFIELFITLWLTLMAGIATGLFISSVSSSSTLAVYLALIVVFYQYVLGGALFNLRDTPVEFLSYGAAARWATLAGGVTADVPSLAEATIACGKELEVDTESLVFDPQTGQPDPNSLTLRETERTACANRPIEVDDLIMPYSDSAEDLVRFWMMEIALAVLFGLGALLAVKRLDRV